MTSLPYDIHDNPTYLAAQMADYAFTGVVKGDSVYCIVGSGTGLGKTYRGNQSLGGAGCAAPSLA
jgi:hypothetical protein